MRVAFASSDGRTIDQHFGTSEQFWVWEITPSRARHVSKITARAHDGTAEDKILVRAQALEGCAMIFIKEIGGPAAAKLVARRIHPLKTSADLPISTMVEKLQKLMRANPPPWMRKLLGMPRPAPSLSAED